MIPCLPFLPARAAQRVDFARGAGRWIGGDPFQHGDAFLKAADAAGQHFVFP
jgi:hypothetical protein